MIGKFITLEGGEGAGKTTLAKRLSQTLIQEGKETLLTREPGGTSLGEEVRNLLLHPNNISIHPRAELFLFLGARAQHVEEVIKPAVKQGKIVFCDRFSDSTIAYQGGGRDLGIDYVSSCCSMATNGLTPDLTFYIDVPVETGLHRAERRELRNNGKNDRIHDENIMFHKKVRDTFLLLAKMHPNRIVVLDSTKSKDALFYSAIEHVKALFKKS